MRAKDSGTNHVRVKVCLTLYKLTGWLALLDLRQPYTRCILSQRTASPHALFDILVLDGGRGKTMNDLVDRDRELPANLTKLHKAKLHTDTHIHKFNKTDTTCRFVLGKQEQDVHARTEFGGIVVTSSSESSQGPTLA